MDDTDWAERLQRATEQAASKQAMAAELLYISAQRYVRAFERGVLNVTHPVLGHLDGDITFTAASLEYSAGQWGEAYRDWQRRGELEAA